MVDGNFHISAYFSYNAHCVSIQLQFLEIFLPIQAISGKCTKSIRLAVSILLTNRL